MVRFSSPFRALRASERETGVLLSETEASLFPSLFHLLLPIVRSRFFPHNPLLSPDTPLTFFIFVTKQSFEDWYKQVREKREKHRKERHERTKKTIDEKLSSSL